MTYEKPQVEVVKFHDVGFMTTSISYTNVGDMLTNLPGVTYTGNPNNFSCPSFGEGQTYTEGNKTQVNINGFIFQLQGENGKKPHWKYIGKQ